MTKSFRNYVKVIFGLLFLSTGLYFIKAFTGLHGFMQVLPYICIGLGCGVFGNGMGEVISKRALKNHPDIEKQIRIEEQDERNVDIGNRAKAKAYDMMIYIFGALMLAFALMGVDMKALLLLVFAYLFVIAYGIYYRSKFEKEM